ncbi:signal peptidase I [Candidatus Parcubacteria bacterium]|nr:MAG: signal peptidase I [Candidatus Parcubacteria bacterium]
MEEDFFEKTAGNNGQDPQKAKSAVFDFIKFVFIVAIIVIPIRLWIAQPFLVNGASMEPTYSSGDYLIVDELSYHVRDPKKEEVIIFRYPKDPSTFFIKRIVGLPNEEITVEGRKIKLKEDEYFVLGDNRDQSSDSRIWGPVPKELIVGRSFIRLWPINQVSLFPGY